ncbi:hypothetical protein FMUND_3494 [Fusarium mundagurra]|uniref:Uncharacterized protein n=1 Tax=Fusarium mundagurra TaxID=1567541 RepID=A0A8H5YZW0_9HYPO|nr:hypothetical protein FMUND_3494 [Fusarium mundagurra]
MSSSRLVEQCQNGQIVGVKTSSAETTTAAETAVSSDAVQPTTSSDACFVGIDGLNGEPPRESRLADCSRLNTVTVSPYPETSTVFKREVAFRIPTAFPTWRPAMNTLAARAEGEPTNSHYYPANRGSCLCYLLRLSRGILRGLLRGWDHCVHDYSSYDDYFHVDHC